VNQLLKITERKGE